MAHGADMTTRHVFVDETKQRGYLVAASIHIGSDTKALRTSLRDLLLPNQRVLHMKDERDSRRRQIAAIIASAGVKSVIYRASSRYTNEKQRREACLRRLIHDVADGVDTLVILDQDDTLLQWDRQKLIEFTRAEDCRDTVRYVHRSGPAEMLLTVPDAIAWCWAKGGEWKTMVQDVVVAEHEV